MIKVETHFKVERNVLIMQHGGEVVRIYVSDIIGFKKAIEKATTKRLEKESSASTLNIAISALKFYYGEILKKNFAYDPCSSESHE